jgi:phosphoglycerate dehydrogenase-like enzyme
MMCDEMVANGPITVWLRLETTPEQRHEIESSVSGCEFLAGDEPERNPGLLERIQVLFSEENVPDETIARMPSLRWFHGTRGGLYSYLTPQLRQRPIPVSGSRGIHGPVFSEFGIAAIFALAKKLPLCWEQQGQHRWQRMMPEDVAGKTLGIIGLGTGGGALALKAHALGMRVVATRRTAAARPPEVDELGTPEFLPRLLEQSDFVVVTLPSVPSTKGMLAEAEMRLMKPNAYFINLTGGNAVSEDTLLKALKGGWIAGAWLDALPKQPLPTESELWGLPNVIITPRIGGLSSSKWPGQRDVFVDNLKRLLAGEPLRNVMDKELGY